MMRFLMGDDHAISRGLIELFWRRELGDWADTSECLTMGLMDALSAAALVRSDR